MSNRCSLNIIPLNIRRHANPFMISRNSGPQKNFRQETIVAMFQRSPLALINYMRLHTRKSASRYSAEYGKTWTKEITPRTKQDIQLYGWYHNYPYHNQNDLTWWGARRRPRHTIASYALRAAPCSIFSDILRQHESTAIHRLSLSGKTTLLLPTDKAFSGADFLESMKSDTEAGRKFLFNHMVKGELDVRVLSHRCKQSRSGSTTMTTLGGKTLPVRVVGSLESGSRQILIGNARVIQHGMRCSNGVVVVLDSLV
jgi:uncharacterized surface protein with fasciclin (FAS1) repeats